jgi:Leucine-rich repeat (LRR) protein
VGELSALKDLKIDGTLREPPRHVLGDGLPSIQLYLRRIGLSRASGNLDLEGMLLQDVQLQYYKLSGLTTLNLSRNELAALPTEVVGYKSLTWLDVSHNRLTELPAKLAALERLRHINVKGNELEEISEDLFVRTALLHLAISNNRIRRLAATGHASRPSTGPEAASPGKLSVRAPTRQASGRPKTGGSVPVGGEWGAAPDDDARELDLNGMQHLVAPGPALSARPG